MPAPETCPRCGRPTDPDLYGGLCPACLIGGVSDSEFNGGSEEPPSPKELARALPEYEVTEIIGRGGMGTVYRARQFELDRDVAIKLIARHADRESADSFAERFAREAQVTAKLDHPAIVPVYSMGYDAEGRSFYTMRLVRGRDFTTIIAMVEKGGSTWNLSRALSVLVRVCQAIAYAHAKGVIHRDLKPPNIMVGELGEVYVLDWGLAKFAGHEDLRDIREELGAHQEAGAKVKLTDATSAALRTLDGAVIGTPAYMSPEQAAGKIDKVDHLADVYSLGAMLYHLLARHPPYMPSESDTTPEKVLSDLLERPPPKLPELRADAPPELVAVCDKAMARERATRYPSALALAEDIQAYLDGRVVAAFESGGLALLKKWVKRNRALASAALLTLLCLVGGLAAIAILQTAAKREVTTALENEQAAFQREQHANQESKANLADAYVRDGLRVADKGNFARAMLWFTHAAETAAHDPDRVAANRLRAKSFGMAGPVPVRVIGGISGADYTVIVPHPHLPFVLLENWEKKHWLAFDIGNEAALRFDAVDGRFKAAAFDPSSARIALSAEDGLVEIRDLRSRALLSSIELGAAAGPIHALAFSKDGGLLFIGAREARVWDSGAGGLRPEILAHDEPPHWARFSDDGRFLLASHPVDNLGREAVRAYSISTGADGGIRPCYEGSRPNICQTAQALPPQFRDASGSTFTTTESPWKCVLWETSTGRRLRDLQTGVVQGFLANGQRVLGHDAIHDLDRGRVVPTGIHGYMRASPDESMLAMLGNGRIVSTADGRDLGAVPVRLSFMEFAHWEGASFLIISAKDSHNQAGGTLSLWRLPAQSVAWTPALSPALTDLAFSPDGNYLCHGGQICTRDELNPTPPPTTLQIFETATGAPASPVIDLGAPILDVKFSPEGKRIAVGLGSASRKPWTGREEPFVDHPGRIEIWSWAPGGAFQRESAIETPSEPHRLAHHPGGRVAALCGSGEVIMLDPAAGAVQPLFRIERGGTTLRFFRGRGADLQFVDAGQVLVAGAIWFPEKFYVWDVAAGKMRFTAPGRDGFATGGGLFFASGDKKPRQPYLFQLGSGLPIPIDSDEPRGRHTGALSADGKFVAWGGFTDEISVWDWREKRRAGRSFQAGFGWHSVDYLDATPWLVSASTGQMQTNVRLRFWDRRSGMLVAPPIEMPKVEFVDVTIVPGTDHGSLVLDYDTRCLDLRFLRTAQWPGGELDDDALRELAELHSMETIEDGQIRAFGIHDWATRWRAFRQRHPGFPALAHHDPATLERYHRERARELGREGNAYGAAWHLQKAEAAGK